MLLEIDYAESQFSGMKLDGVCGQCNRIASLFCLQDYTYLENAVYISNDFHLKILGLL